MRVGALCLHRAAQAVNALYMLVSTHTDATATLNSTGKCHTALVQLTRRSAAASGIASERGANLVC
jgi:hypothetical protein